MKEMTLDNIRMASDEDLIRMLSGACCLAGWNLEEIRFSCQKAGVKLNLRLARLLIKAHKFYVQVGGNLPSKAKLFNLFQGETMDLFDGDVKLPFSLLSIPLDEVPP